MPLIYLDSDNILNRGTLPNDNTGDTLRAAALKINTNFENLDSNLNLVNINANKSSRFSVDKSLLDSPGRAGTFLNASLSVGKAVFYNSTLGLWTGAFEDSDNVASHIIVSTKPLTFDLAQTGVFELESDGQNFNNLSPNRYYYIPDSAGTFPVTTQNINTYQLLYYALDSNTIDLNISEAQVFASELETLIKGTSATAPDPKVETDENTGLFTDSDDALKIATGGVTAATFKSTGITTVGGNFSGNITGSGNLNIAGNSSVSGNGDFTGVVNINDTTTSTNTATGALIVDGGTGIAENLNIGGDLNVGTNADISGTLDVTLTTTMTTVSLDSIGVTRDITSGGLIQANALVSDTSLTAGTSVSAGTTLSVGTDLTVSGTSTFNNNISMDSGVAAGNVTTGTTFDISKSNNHI